MLSGKERYHEETKLENHTHCHMAVAAGICYSCSHVPSHSTDSEWKLELSDDPEDTQEETTSDDRTESDPAVLYVYVCGEIQNPGVWELRPGDRIFRAIEMAGGVTEDAAVDSLNLAAEVTDGMKLWVPSREEMKALGEKNGDVRCLQKMAGPDRKRRKVFPEER